MEGEHVNKFCEVAEGYQICSCLHHSGALLPRSRAPLSTHPFVYLSVQLSVHLSILLSPSPSPFEDPAHPGGQVHALVSKNTSKETNPASFEPPMARRKLKPKSPPHPDPGSA